MSVYQATQQRHLVGQLFEEHTFHTTWEEPFSPALYSYFVSDEDSSEAQRDRRARPVRLRDIAVQRVRAVRHQLRQREAAPAHHLLDPRRRAGMMNEYAGGVATRMQPLVST